MNGSLYGSFAGGVYELNASGAERLLAGDMKPYGGLTVLDGMLYVAAANSQTLRGVFSLTASGSEKLVLDAFGLGVTPVGEFITVDNALYGTMMGYSDDCFCDLGYEYRVSPSGTGSDLYIFTGKQDEEFPAAGLLYSNGDFYGTTSCYDNYFDTYYCAGTVFSLSPAGAETTLYHFKGGSDGSHPFDSLVYLHGSLYGTTSAGGIGDNGTVFAISPTGSEHVLHRFKNMPDGSEPMAHLTIVGDALYGTTVKGGANGLGTIFKITTTGLEEVVHSFSQGDGIQPYSGLRYHNGVIYGTTGGGSAGGGTVFERKP